MGIRLKPLVKVFDLFMHKHLLDYFLLEDLELSLVWKVAVEQQEARLQEGAVLRELVDGVASVQELTLLTIDVSDGGDAACSGGETGVISEKTCFLEELRTTEGVRADGGRVEVEIVGFSGWHLNTAFLGRFRKLGDEVLPSAWALQNVNVLVNIQLVDSLDEVRQLLILNLTLLWSALFFILHLKVLEIFQVVHVSNIFLS